MSKVVASLPEGMVKGGFVGAVVSLVCYVLLQFLSALLISKEMVGEEMLYPIVCLSAGMSSFAGCWCGTNRSKGGRGLGAATVVVVFLALTIVIGFLSGEVGVIGDGLVGIGVSMSLGGLMVACIKRKKTIKTRRERVKGRRDRR